MKKYLHPFPRSRACSRLCPIRVRQTTAARRLNRFVILTLLTLSVVVQSCGGESGENTDAFNDPAPASANPTNISIAPGDTNGGTVDALAVPALNPQFQFPENADRLRSEQVNVDEVPLAYLETRIETDFQTQLTRMTSNEIFGVVNGEAVHFYSKRQAWNADQTLIDIGDKILDASTYDIVLDNNRLSTARNWSNLSPNHMYGISSNESVNEFSVYDYSTNTVVPRYVFEGMRDCSFGRFEGNITMDDRYVVIICTNIDTNQPMLISFDIANNNIIATRAGEQNLDWASFSQRGDFILVENNAYPFDDGTLVVYDKYLQNERFIGEPNHGDLGFDDQGNEVYVMVGKETVRYVRLDNGVQYVLPIGNSSTPIGYGHISCRNRFRPGWCYFSSSETNWLGAVKISETDSAVEHWGYHRSTGSSYSAIAKASVDRFGTQLIFSSDWFGRSEINDYILRLPPEGLR